MALRQFQDGKGNQWRVWDTRPERSAVHEDLQGGWLTFEFGPHRRRLTPIPAGWDALTDDELRRLCVEARPVPKRKRLIE
jgi:hypothetical protein